MKKWNSENHPQLRQTVISRAFSFPGDYSSETEKNIPLAQKAKILLLIENILWSHIHGVCPGTFPIENYYYMPLFAFLYDNWCLRKSYLERHSMWQLLSLDIMKSFHSGPGLVFLLAALKYDYRWNSMILSNYKKSSVLYPC